LGSKPPLFINNDFGAAAEWWFFLEYFSSRDCQSYAISVRGHETPARGLLGGPLHVSAPDDLDDKAGIRHVIDKHQFKGCPDIVPVAHSAGGALLQYILSEGLHSSPDPKETDVQEYEVGRMGLLGIIPCYESLGVHGNWTQPVLPLRMYLFHFGHLRSSLSSTRLVKQAFFCNEYPDEGFRESEM
jgi:hypothetical protein